MQSITLDINQYIKKNICGTSHNMILMKNGSLYAIGDNTQNQLGSIDTGVTFNTINKIENSNWIDVATNYNTTFAINELGNIYYWGAAFNNNILPAVTTPNKIFFSYTLKAKKIACGLNHLLVLDTDNNLYGYGDNSKDQISGDINVSILNSNFKKISLFPYNNIYCNSNYSVISRDSGISYITGRFINEAQIKSEFYELTDGITTKLNSISCGPNHFIYTTFTTINNTKIINNNIITIGSNKFGKLGNNIDDNETTLSNVSNSISDTPIYIYAGIIDTYVVDNTFNLYVCGKYNNNINTRFTKIENLTNITNDINIVSNTIYTIISYDKFINIITLQPEFFDLFKVGFNNIYTIVSQTTSAINITNKKNNNIIIIIIISVIVIITITAFIIYYNKKH